MSSILFRNGVIHSPADAFAEALLIEDGVIAWLGADDSAAGFLNRADEVVDLDGLLVTPAFVDAHVHLLATGLALEGVALSPDSGVHSATDLLMAVASRSAQTRASGEGTVLYGHGWDESAWAHPTIPHREDLDQAGAGQPVLLVRSDVHSSLVSSAFAERFALKDLAGWDDSGHITLDAHNRALAALTHVPPSRHDALTDLALHAAAAAGIVAVHEMATPDLETRAGLARLISRTSHSDSALPQVIGYWGELCESDADAHDIKEAIPGVTGVGGDLCVDGSIGSHTAALLEPYSDRMGPTATGSLHLTAAEIAIHIQATTRVGLPSAFHVIGDGAMQEVLAGFAAAAEEIGAARVQAMGHRLEHAEMVDPQALAALVRFGIRLSMQPSFDDEWGGPGALYETRLGTARAAQMNPWASIAEAGIPLAFGSDTPVTKFDPWRAVRSALFANTESQRISARSAFRAHTRGGWRLAGSDHTGAGEIRVGAPAHLAFWEAPQRAVQGPDRLFSNWSTDARAGTPLLPELGPKSAEPQCVRTMRAGVTIFDSAH